MVKLALVIIVLLQTVCVAQVEPTQPDVKSLIDKTFIACRDLELFSAAKTKDNRLDFGARITKTPSDAFVAAKIVEAEVTGYSVHAFDILLRLELANGKTAVWKTRLHEDYNSDHGDELLKGIFRFERVMGNVLLTLPPSIKEGDNVFLEAGMPVTAAKCLLGQPERENDYGNAGKQLIYDKGRTILYVKKNGTTVTDIQHTN